jgi:hypothetical protein
MTNVQPRAQAPNGPSEQHDAATLDWASAVDAAAARLIQAWHARDTNDHMVQSGLADEFAATLCAYGMAPDEIARHLHDLIGDPLASDRAVRDCHVTPASNPSERD